MRFGVFVKYAKLVVGSMLVGIFNHDLYCRGFIILDIEYKGVNMLFD